MNTNISRKKKSKIEYIYFTIMSIVKYFFRSVQDVKKKSIIIIFLKIILHIQEIPI